MASMKWRQMACVEYRRMYYHVSMDTLGPMTHEDTRLPLMRWPRYHVDLVEDDEWLRFAAESHGASSVTPRPGALLTRFCALREAPVLKIRAFALDHGPLCLCEAHSLPEGGGRDHSVLDFRQRLKAREFCNTKRAPGGERLEAVLVWRVWMQRLAGARKVATALRTGKVLRTTDVDDAGYGLTRNGWLDGLRENPSNHVARFDFARWLNYLLALADVKKSIRATRTLELVDGLDPRFPLFGALVLDLIGVATGARAVQECENPECSRLVFPKLGTERYCPRCRKNSRARWRLAKRQERAALRADGKSARGRLLTSKR